MHRHIERVLAQLLENELQREVQHQFGRGGFLQVVEDFLLRRGVRKEVDDKVRVSD